jgi:hypothetical protein
VAERPGPGGTPASADPAGTPASADPAGEQHSAGSAGPRRALITLYAIFALAATSRAVVQLATKFHEAPLAYALSLFSGLVYIGATVGLVTNRRWSRGLAWAACGTELAGVLAIGVLTIVDAVAFPDDTVWSRFGSGYVYIPVVLPLLGLGWLWSSRPRRADSEAATA